MTFFRLHRLSLITNSFFLFPKDPLSVVIDFLLVTKLTFERPLYPSSHIFYDPVTHFLKDLFVRHHITQLPCLPGKTGRPKLRGGLSPTPMCIMYEIAFSHLHNMSCFFYSRCRADKSSPMQINRQIK